MTVRRSFFAETVEQALAEASHRMGPETLLVSSRRTGAAERHLGVYEVIVEGAATPPREASTLGPDLAPPVGASLSSCPGDSARDALELKHIRRELTSMRDLLARCAAQMSPNLPPALLPFGERLSTADFSPALVESLLSSSALRLAGAGPEIAEADVSSAIAAEISKRLRVDSELSAPSNSRRVVAFAGPPGGGKTSTLVKLAIRLGLTQRKPTLVITADTYRVAAADQLQSYAAILGVSYEAIETPSGLLQSLEEHRSKELVLIDLPGMGPREPELMRAWSPAVSAAGIEVHLVLPATMRCSDLARTAGRFEPLRPAHLIFTHLDETACHGGILSLAIDTGRPVSYLCNGQSIPEDIEPATRQALLRLAGAVELAAGTAA